VTRAVPATPSAVAVMVAWPGRTPVTTPELLTRATFDASLLQLIERSAPDHPR
jgi:hypothetical protein